MASGDEWRGFNDGANITKTMANAVKCKTNAVLFCGAGAASRDAQAGHAAGDDGGTIDAER